MAWTIVFISATPPQMRGNGSPAFTGHLEQEDPSRLLEQGPGWDDVEDAIAWGRERSARVSVRIGPTSEHIYSAGTERLPIRGDEPDVLAPEWPPGV